MKIEKTTVKEGSQIMADNNETNTESVIPKRTIKLKPANPSAAAAPTMKLKNPAAPQAPAAPAVSTDTAKLARRTIKLVPQSGSPLSGPATAPATPAPITIQSYIYFPYLSLFAK